MSLDALPEPRSAQIEPARSILDLPRRRFEVVPAIREPMPLLIGLTGPSGSGKTFSALRLATGIAREVQAAGGSRGGPQGRPQGVVFIDTENKRSRHYAGEFEFQHLDFQAPYSSGDYLEALNAAAAVQPAVIVIDSLSHEHDGPGGMLDAVGAELDRIAGSDPIQQQKLAAAAWRRPKTARRALLSRLLTLNIHVIVCMRAQERSRMSREAQSVDPVDMGYVPVAAPEIMFELGLCALLKAGAQGVPTWASLLPGEHAAIKLPRQFERMFASSEPLSEVHGEALARWASGETPAPVPRRRGRKPKGQGQTPTAGIALAKAGSPSRTAEPSVRMAAGAGGPPPGSDQLASASVHIPIAAPELAPVNGEIR